MGLNFLSIFNAKSDAEALDKLLESGKGKLIEAGRELVKALGDEADGFQVDVSIKISRKPNVT